MALALVLTLLSAVGRSGAAVAPPDTFVPLSVPSVYVPITPTRVFEGVLAQSGLPSEQIELASYVPSGATAVAVNVTTLRLNLGWPPGVWVCGLPRVDYQCKSLGIADTGSSLLTVAVGSDRTLLLGGAPDFVVADLMGYYVPAGLTPTAGRFRAVTPVRMLDTREGGNMVDNDAVTVNLNSALPADAASAVMNITVVDTEREGYVTAFPAGSAPPYISNLLALPPVRTVSNQAIVPLQNGAVSVKFTGRAHVLVDLVGFFTSGAAPTGTDGLFVPLMNTTIYNSLEEQPRPRPAGAISSIAFTPPIFGPSIGSLLIDATAQNGEAGFLTVWGPGTQPWTTNLSLDSYGSARGTAITATDGPSIHAYLSSATWFLQIDAVGFFTA